MTCDCGICQRHRRVADVMSRLSPADAKVIEYLIETLDNAEMDRDVRQSELDGVWPADEVRVLKRAKDQSHDPALGVHYKIIYWRMPARIRKLLGLPDQKDNGKIE